MKSLYIFFVRLLRVPLKVLGLLALMQQWGQTSRFFRWFRSLFAIYDIDDLVKLDLPWWTLAATDYVDGFLANKPTARVFEYGSGASSFWLLKRGANVTSVEHDENWFEEVAGRAADHANIEINHIAPARPEEGQSSSEFLSGREGYAGMSFEAYVRSVEVGGPYDLIIIDGRARSACLKAGLAQRAAGGIILFDNAGRDRYQPAIEAAGLTCTKFTGLTACLPYPDATYILSGGPL